MHTSLALSWLIAHFADISRTSCTALIAAIWQGALLAAAAALTLRLVPHIPAAARFAIWAAVFILIAALPLTAIAPHRSIASPATEYLWFSINARWTIAIAVLWTAASLIRAATLVAAALRVHSLSRNATPIHLSRTLAPTSARRMQVCSSADVDRPTVIGFFAPKILIPIWLLEKLTPQELEHVILHEAGHLDRADDWLNLLQKLTLVVFPLNPALAWVERRLCFERELACDERVLNELASRDHAATSYASSLTTLAEYRLQRRGLVHNLALALGALGTSARKSELARRIVHILRPATSMKPLHARIATAGAIATLVFAAAKLEHSPQLISFAAPATETQRATAPSLPGVDRESGTPSYAQRTVGSANAGYRAVSAHITLSAAPQSKSIGDSAPDRALTVRADRTQRPSPPPLIAARQPEQQPDLVITRYTVTSWQSADGYRVVRTSAVISNARAAEAGSESYGDNNDAPPQPRTRIARAQQISPYAAVPVPGGWLVFEL